MVEGEQLTELNERRSRKGAWIEIRKDSSELYNRFSRSRKGAWIEIGNLATACGEIGRRSRKGAWIEITLKLP